MSSIEHVDESTRDGNTVAESRQNWDEQTGFGMVMTRVLEQVDMSMKAAIAYVSLTTFVQREEGHKERGSCFVHRGTAAARAKQSVKSFDRAVKELESIGLVTVQRRKHANGGHKSSIYRVFDQAGQYRVLTVQEGVASDCPHPGVNLSPPSGQVVPTLASDCPEGGDRLTHLEQTTQHTTGQTTGQTTGSYLSLAAAPPNESGEPSINHPPKTRPQSATSTMDSEPDQPVMLNFTTDLDRKTDERLAKQTATVAKKSSNPHRDAVLAKKDAKREAFVEEWAEMDKETHQYEWDAGPAWDAFVAEFEARKKREGLDWHIKPWVATKIRAIIAECLVKGHRYAGIHEVTNVMVDCARRADKPYLDNAVSRWLANNGMVDPTTKKWKGHLGASYRIAEIEEEFGTQMVDTEDGGTWSLSPLAKKDEAEEKAFQAEHGMSRDEARYEAKRAESARKLEERAAAEEAEEEARRLARLQHEAERPQREAEAAAQAKMFEEYRARAAAPVHIPVQRSTFNRGGAQAAKIEQDEAAKVEQSEQRKLESQALHERLDAIREARLAKENAAAAQAKAKKKPVPPSWQPDQEFQDQVRAAVAEAEAMLARLAADGWNYQKPEPRKVRVA